MINYYWVSIQGKNLKQFILMMLKNKINIAEIKYKKESILLKVSYDDYNKLRNIKTTHKISIIKVSGKTKIVQIYKKYKKPILIFIISIFFIIFLSNLILFINIETDNNKLKNTIKKELINNNVSLYTYKKSYQKLKKISDNIKSDNPNTIEWIELEQKGVVLNVKIIPRVKKNKKTNNEYKDVVAAKDGYIRKIYAKKGQLLKNIDDYVKKGEIIISGNIFRNDNVVGKVKAEGKVYAEVWYIIKENKSLYYKEAKEKNIGKFKLTIIINNKRINIITLPKKVQRNKTINIFSNNTFLLQITEKKAYSLKNRKYDSYELKQILEIKAKKELLKTLDKDEYIISQKTLKKRTYNGKMYIDVFFKCYENIAEEKDIQKIEEKKEE